MPLLQRKGSNTRVYNFDIPSEQVYMNEDPIDEDMQDITDDAQLEENPLVLTQVGVIRS